MKFSLYLDDFQTEKIFSYLRWIFLGFAIILFYTPTISLALSVNHTSFPILLTVGLVYMTFSQFALSKINADHQLFKIIVKSGIAFDFIALIWLLILTDGINSPLFPITYLFIMHATIYWKTKGALLSSFFSTVGYSSLLVFETHFSTQLWSLYFLNLSFIWIVGLFGSLIVLRERKHLIQKNLFYESMKKDYLTGLNNHKSFQEEFNIHITKQDPFLLLIGDIDYFKVINDTYGHIVGDEVLKELGKVLNEITIKNNGKAFRYGGEEFTFLFPKADEPRMNDILNQIYSGMNELSFTKEAWSITMSFGVTSSSSTETAEDMIKKADMLLYKAKKQGKNRAIFDNGLVVYNTLDKQMSCERLSLN